MSTQKYAPLVFIGMEDLVQAVEQSKPDSSYELAKMRLPKDTLQMTAVGKFHELSAPITSPTIDTLAQIEIIDADNNPEHILIETYRALLDQQGYGRISVVGSEGTTYDLADQLLQLAQLASSVEETKPLLAQLDENAVSHSYDELILKVVTLQDTIHKLSDRRSANGFSHEENKTYGYASIFCSIFSTEIQEYAKKNKDTTNYPENTLIQLVELGQQVNTLLRDQEHKSAKGINLPVYFNPRLKPEDVQNNI